MATDKYTRLELTIYAVGWTIVFCLPLLMQTFEVLSGESYGYRWDRIVRSIQMLMPMLLLFVLHDTVLLPHLFLKRKKGLYFLTLAVAFVLLWYIQEPPMPNPHINPQMMEPGFVPEGPRGRPLPRPIQHGPFDMFHIMHLIIGLCIVFANFGIKLYIQSLRRDVQMLNIQNEKMLQELQSLKYQISPHFLMNTLNNIQSLIETSPATALSTIQQLSKMMRYLLYDNNTQSVPLDKEVEFMRNFINLMRIRYPDTVKISADFPEDGGGVCIPPLLFVSFIENAFKYGVSYTDESVISVKLTMEDSRLIFRCANFISPDANRRRTGTGIGIKNVRRRLDLIYGDRYSLEISESDGMFIVEMKLPVDEGSECKEEWS
ncbi:MAG: histidine kinase [Bacteroidaceae bacterium]|nr:histidine kinase [Bacteroidaceae bacterium]